MKPQDVERMLANVPAPPPPEGLAERIVDEIPEVVEVGSRRLSHRQSWLAAAAALTAALCGGIAWQMLRPGPPPAPAPAAVVATPVPIRVTMQRPTPVPSSEPTFPYVAEVPPRAPQPTPPPPSEAGDGEQPGAGFLAEPTSGLVATAVDNRSSFGLAVGSGSYAAVRRYLAGGALPPPGAVRVEELVNAFDYGDPPPEQGDFALTAEAAPSPFGKGARPVLVRFAVRGRLVVAAAGRPAVEPIAREARTEVEFNPEVVSAYRLLGYEGRGDAGPQATGAIVEAGQAVTALYLVDLVDQPRGDATLATLRLRYRSVVEGRQVELEEPIRVADVAASWEDAPRALRLASLVAEYGELLRGPYRSRAGDMLEVLRRARELAPDFAGDSRVTEFTSLVATTAQLLGRLAQP